MKNIELSVPLFIRLMEYAKESAKTDMDLHFITEALMAKDQHWSMKDYDAIIKSIPNKI